MATPFLSEIVMVSFSFAPKGYALCNGQLLPINQNQPLFALLGTTFGGNGQTNFALPNFRGRFPMHEGNGFTRGSAQGSATTTLSIATMPAHVHPVDAKITMELGGTATTTSPDSTFLAAAPAGSPRYSSRADDRMAQADIGTMMDDTNTPLTTELSPGGTQPFDNMKPYLGINFIIALQGVFPSQT